MEDIKRIDIKEFRELGLLQEANRLFFHPLGLALEVTIGDDGTEKLGGIWDYRDDPEGVLFSDIDEKLLGIAREIIVKRHEMRLQTIGFVTQT